MGGRMGGFAMSCNYIMFSIHTRVAPPKSFYQEIGIKLVYSKRDSTRMNFTASKDQRALILIDIHFLSLSPGYFNGFNFYNLHRFEIQKKNYPRSI